MSIVWVSGYPCSGKSFIGDYLMSEHGFHHVDGDWASQSKKPEDKELWANNVAAAAVFTSGQNPPEELWVPFFDILCQRAKQAVSEGKRAVISYPLFNAKLRDWVRNRIEGQEFKIVMLDSDIQVLIDRFFERTNATV